MSYGLEIVNHVGEAGAVYEVRLSGFYTSADIEDLLRLRDRLNIRQHHQAGDVIIDATAAFIDDSAEGAFAVLGRELVRCGKMLHIVVGERGRPTMADIGSKYRGISFHKDMDSAMESAGAVTVAA